jgi:hypothetical protein
MAGGERALLEAWRDRARKSMEAHYAAASWRTWANGGLSAAVVIISTIVGSSLFAHVGQGGDAHWVIGTLSIVAAILVGLQRAMRLTEEAERHRHAGASWDRLFNFVCKELVDPDADLTAVAERARKWMETLVGESPVIPQRSFDKVKLAASYDSARAASSDTQAP